jgi:hypothetical protein
MDDDDWYGPGYLAEFAAAFALGAQFAGKTRGTMTLQDGTIVRNQRGGACFAGAAMGSTVNDIRFPDQRIGEDHALHAIAIKRGLRCERLSDRHHLYRRDRPGPRAWEECETFVLRSLPGDWDILGRDPAVVTEESPRVLGVRPEPTPDEIYAALARKRK